MPVMNFDVKKFKEIDRKTLHNIFLIRSEVFIVEQECAYQDIDGKDLKSIHIIGKKKEEIIAWLEDWKFALGKENKSFDTLAIKLDEINPAYIPRNHQIQEAIDQAYENDFSKMLEMIEVIKQPFTERSMYEIYASAPKENQKVNRTFCGT